MINPTGGQIRNDSKGQGHYRAKRGRRLHKGTDYECVPGQRVRASIAGKIRRKVQAYPGEPEWVGVELVGKRVTVKLLYVALYPALIGTTVVAGAFIGVAQDISLKYGPEMTPHVHCEITAIDPECLMDS